MEKSFVKTGLPDNGRITATARLESLSNQAPYFSITGNFKDKHSDMGGCIHSEIAEHFPQLAPYIRWHLTSTNGPMHYLANAMYHAGFCLGMESSRNLEYLASTIVYGAVEGDADTDLTALDGPQLKDWLITRFPALMQQFKVDMNTLFGAEVVTEVAAEPYPYDVARISTPESREALRLKKRQGLIDTAAKKAQQEQTELNGKLWLMDRGLNVDNVIYYNHRDIFTFGWRDVVTDMEKGAILDVISEFPFEYEIKTAQGVLSGRE